MDADDRVLAKESKLEQKGQIIYGNINFSVPQWPWERAVFSKLEIAKNWR